MDVSKFMLYAVISIVIRLCSSVPLNDFFPFGDSSPLDIKDGVSSAIDLSLSISIKLADCSSVVATMNISVGGQIDLHLADASPQMSLKPFTISPADIDSHVIHRLSRGDFLASGLKDKLFAPFQESFRNYSQFEPIAYTTITWTLEQSYGSSSDITFVDTFQVFLATNGTWSMVVYLYADGMLQWRSTQSSMGINVCSSSWIHPTPGTLLDGLVNESNVNIPGMWMFLIQDSELILPVPCSEGCSFETGTCQEPNTCSCISGWTGDTCTTPHCPDGCVNGMCNSPFTCTCSEGWLELDCSVAMCRNTCRNGMCEIPNVCTCNDGWEDDNCNTPICTNECVNGTCIGPNDCQCTDGYVGELCDVPVCLGGADCMGYCRVPGECICDTGYRGVLCNELIPTEPDTRTDDGESESTGLSGEAIGGIIGGIIGFVVIVIALVFFIACTLCCFYF